MGEGPTTENSGTIGPTVPTNHESLNEPHPTGGVTRRRALQILGAVPAAAALGVQEAPAQQPTKPLQPPTTGQLPSTPTPGAATQGPKFFNKHEWATVAMLADYVIPKDEHSGSAKSIRRL